MTHILKHMTLLEPKLTRLMKIWVDLQCAKAV